MKCNHNRLIFHIDVNSAFLSWTAAYMLQHGSTLDLRDIPSVIGGNEEIRHGIVLAKSIPAKKYKIKTGEPLLSARQKCPNLKIVPPSYNIYSECSNAMLSIFQEYTPSIQRYSIDECFLDFTNMSHIYPDYMELAYTIKEKIKKELGFTVNIGISNNKLLAKMACDLEKPDKVHTLFPHEIKEKMWPLPIEDLFMVGRATAPKLRKLNITTIGELAEFDPILIKAMLKSHGLLIWNYANGIENSKVNSYTNTNVKSIGNSTTTAFNIEDKQTAYKVLLSLCESVCMRLRQFNKLCKLISVNIRSSEFVSCSHQSVLFTPTDCTNKIYESCCRLFDEIWKGEPLRHMGISISQLCTNKAYQLSLFEDAVMTEKQKSLDKTIDELRIKYGKKAIMRSTFLNSGLNSITGGVSDEDHPLMSSML